MVRYRAYHSKGLSAAQVAVLVAICSLTFVLGTVLLGGLISLFEPEQLSRFRGLLPEKFRFLTDPTTARLAGVGYFAVLAVFIASFSAALWSNAPGGLGVFEWLFIGAMPEMPKTQVLAALLVFRLFYLLIPFFLSIYVVIIFESNRLEEVLHHGDSHAKPGAEIKQEVHR